MRTHIREYIPNATREYNALDHRLSGPSIVRFLQDDRVWPIEVWMTRKDQDGRIRLGLLRFHPDPTDPEAGTDPGGKNPLRRNWNDRLETTMGKIQATIRECPEEIIAQCVMETEIEKFLAVLWEYDNGKPPRYLNRGEKP